MRCPRCRDLDLLSRVFVGPSFSTLAYTPGYFDEQGHYHFHGGSPTITGYSCSQGHQWSETRKARCPTCEPTAVGGRNSA